jgi:hypothetical protein
LFQSFERALILDKFIQIMFALRLLACKVAISGSDRRKNSIEKQMKLTTHILPGALAAVSAFVFASCGPMHPGGLSDEEWYSLPPAKRAQLELQQERLNEQRSRDINQEIHWNKQDSNSQSDLDRELSRDAGESARKLQGYGY